MKESHFVIYLV